MQVAVKPDKSRESSIELYRIIIMLLIIAHHYVVNSDLTALDGPIACEPLTHKSFALLVAGAWGKTGINCFVMISSYYLCELKFSLKKMLKLYFEVYFYKNLIMMIFVLTGYTEVPKLGIKNVLPFYVGTDFVSAFLFYYMIFAFLNIMLKNLSQKQHLILICILGYIFVFLGTFQGLKVIFNYVEWFVFIHIVMAYVRYYPKNIYNNSKIWGVLLIIFLMTSVFSILLCLRNGIKTSSFYPYRYLADSNTFLAFANGLCSFMFIKNINIRYSKVINGIAKTCFGVLLIHASSDTMRQWLWKDFLNNIGAFEGDFWAVHIVFSVIFVFVSCAFLDAVRILLLEKRFLQTYDYCSTWINNKRNME